MLDGKRNSLASHFERLHLGVALGYDLWKCGDKNQKAAFLLRFEHNIECLRFFQGVSPRHLLGGTCLMRKYHLAAGS
jgi:hypothetical protein